MNTDPAVVHVQDPSSSLLTLDEISLLVSRNGNPSETLSNIATVIRERCATDVCSVYLLEPDRANLVLAATVGLRPESVGQVRMRITEGLAGLVAEQVRAVVVPDATAHPRFKYFRDAGEEPFRTFMGVPVIDRGVLQGVLVVQTRESRAFTDEDVQDAPMQARSCRPSSAKRARLGSSWRRCTSASPRSRRTSGGAGTTRASACFAIWIRCSGSSATTTRSRCCSRSRSTGSRAAPRRWRCTAASTTPTGASRST